MSDGVNGQHRSAWADYLAADPRVGLSIDDEDGRRVVCQGTAHLVERPNVGGRWVDIGRRMAARYRGEAGVAYLEATLDQERWLFHVAPERLVTWNGVGWHEKYARQGAEQHRRPLHASEAGHPGRAMAKALRPERDDYFVLKPKHSAFFSTTLDTLLAYLGAPTLILTGVAGNICVFFSANDAYMRDFGLVVPADCVASNTVAQNDRPLAQMRRILRADTTPSPELDLARLLREARAGCPSLYERIESSEPVAQGSAGEVRRAIP